MQGEEKIHVGSAGHGCAGLSRPGLAKVGPDDPWGRLNLGFYDSMMCVRVLVYSQLVGTKKNVVASSSTSLHTVGRTP